MGMLKKLLIITSALVVIGAVAWLQLVDSVDIEGMKTPL